MINEERGQSATEMLIILGRAYCCCINSFVMAFSDQTALVNKSIMRRGTAANSTINAINEL